ncbi:MAG: hypothetical protein KDC92_16615, partial [Bacteroidetes bacterium]|nr:hypothetical protein [Bacteroidota bacterium]
ISVVQPKYNDNELVTLFTTTNGTPANGCDLSQENGFFGHHFLLKTLYKNNKYPIVPTGTQGNIVAGYVENNGLLTFALVTGSETNKSLVLYKSLEGLENVDYEYAYKGPAHIAIAKHNLSVPNISSGDETTGLTQSLFIRKNNQLYIMLGFTNGTSKCIEVNRNNYTLKVNQNLQYPAAATSENWLGMSTQNVGTFYTYNSSNLVVNKYSGNGSSTISLPNFKTFTTQQGGIIGVTYSNNSLYLLIYNDYNIYVYTKDL